jgi:hypothetical protein
MKRYLFLLVIISVAFLYSCKCSKHCKKTDTENTTTQVTPFNEGNTVVNDSIYRVIVSFISLGEGTDARMKESFDSYIAQFEKDSNKKIIVDKYGWGREGEQDVCLKLKTFASAEQDKFVEGAKKLFGTSDRIIVIENAVCKHKK